MFEMMTYEQAVTTLATKTAMTREDWLDFFSATPAQQAAIAKAYRDASWVKSPDVFADVLAILNVLVTIAGAVSGVSGAVAAVMALKGV